jgi:hypothetical protein
MRPAYTSFFVKAAPMVATLEPTKVPLTYLQDASVRTRACRCMHPFRRDRAHGSAEPPSPCTAPIKQ